MLKKAKQSFVVDEINHNIDDAKKFWAAMKNLVPSKGKKSRVINLVDIHGVEIAQEEAADYVNKYFTGIGPKLAEKLVDPWEFKGTPCMNAMPDIVVNKNMVTKNCKGNQY